jgi:hypothetical protein
MHTDDHSASESRLAWIFGSPTNRKHLVLRMLAHPWRLETGGRGMSPPDAGGPPSPPLVCALSHGLQVISHRSRCRHTILANGTLQRITQRTKRTGKAHCFFNICMPTRAVPEDERTLVATAGRQSGDSVTT